MTATSSVSEPRLAPGRAQAGRAFLGVERSIGGRRWLHALDTRTEGAAERIAELARVPEIVARVLAARGVVPAAAATFLSPTVRELMPDPSTLTDMDAAAARLADAIERREHVAIFGDYDVDGAASVALLHRYLAHFGLDARIYIPDRVTEGYGPTPRAMRELAAAGASLIVTVDCGTASFAAIDAAKQAGAAIVVLDHHQTGPDLPAAAALVNPNRQDDLSGQGHLCAAGVVFLVLTALSRELRRRGRADLPDLLGELDLVALATVCDVVPLVGFNRALVVKGLQVLQKRRNRGLAALARAARLTCPVEAYHLGFILGPRINAGGRIGEADLGTRLLVSDDEAAAEFLAEQLDRLNGERQVIERRMLEEADAEVAAEIGAGEGPPILIAGRSAWHPGIVGLIAARLRERHHRPAFAIAFDAGGRGTGSGRSIAGFDLGRLVRAAVEDGLLVKGGGHSMAAGFTIERERLAAFRAFAEERARAAVSALRDADALAIDGALSASAFTGDLVRKLEQAGPFGSGHSQPVLALPRVRIAAASLVGGSHVRATLKAVDGSAVSAIAFRAAGTDIGRRLLDRGARLIHAVGHVGLDRYNGRETVGFRLIDLAEADG